MRLSTPKASATDVNRMASWRTATVGLLLFMTLWSTPSAADEGMDPFFLKVQSLGFGELVDPTKATQPERIDIREALPFLFSGPSLDHIEFEDYEDTLDEQPWRLTDAEESWGHFRAVPVQVLSFNRGAAFGGFGDLFREDPLNDWVDRQLSVFNELFGESDGLFGDRMPTVSVHVMQQEGQQDEDDDEDTMKCLDAVAEARFVSAMRDLHQLQADADRLVADSRNRNMFSGVRFGDGQLNNSVGRSIAPQSAAWLPLAAALLAAVSVAGAAAGCFCCSSFRNPEKDSTASYPYSVSQPLLSKSAASGSDSRAKDSIVIAADNAEYVNIDYVPLKGEQTP